MWIVAWLRATKPATRMTDNFVNIAADEVGDQFQQESTTTGDMFGWMCSYNEMVSMFRELIVLILWVKL